MFSSYCMSNNTMIDASEFVKPLVKMPTQCSVQLTYLIVMMPSLRMAAYNHIRFTRCVFDA